MTDAAGGAAAGGAAGAGPAGRLNLLGGYGAWAERIASAPGELSFSRTVGSGACSFEEWKRLGRARVRELLGPLPAGGLEAGGQPPRATTVRRFRFEGLDIEELSWELPYGPPTSALLLAPAGARGPLPGVLALHDHGNLKRFGGAKIAQAAAEAPPVIAEHRARYYGGRAWANELARRGFCVLAHDVFPFGSRRIDASEVPAHVVERLMADPAGLPTLTPEATAPGRRSTDVDPSPARYEGFAWQHEDVVARSLFALGLTFPGVTLAEDLAGLQVLAARPEVDPRRLGCCGLSAGGLRACFLAGLTDTVRAAVTAGFMSTWRDFALWNGYVHTWGLFVPHLARSLDLAEVLALRAPLPSLVLACDGDLIFDPGEVRRAEEMLAAVYRGAGAAASGESRHFPCPHSFSPAMQDAAFAWLERWLSGRGVSPPRS